MKRIAAILLSLMVLISSFNTTFATHYCGGKAIKSSLSFGHEDLSCGMAMGESSCSKNNHQQNVSKKCCDTVYYNMDVDDFNVSNEYKPTLNINFLTAFVFSYINNFFSVSEINSPFKGYLPPIQDRDISVLFQVFRI